MKRILLVPSLLIFLAGCVTTKNHDEFHGTSVRWYDGSVEDAFKLAKAENKPVFLYWGASWCPPCNEIKAQVFTSPSFAELMNLAIPVYLDGDTERAQVWGDKLKASGYPTLLVLDANKRELMRIAEFVTPEEFKIAFQAGVGSSVSFAESLDRASKNRATKQDWQRLAYFNWYQSKDLDLESAKVLGLRKKAADYAPKSLPIERALLSAKALSAAAAFKDQSHRTVKSVKKRSEHYLTAIFASPETIVATRSTILYDSKKIISFLYPNQKKQQVLLQNKWLTAAYLIEKSKTLSTDTRLWAIFPQVQFHQMNAKEDAPVPADLRERVKKAVQQADAEAKTAFARQAVVSGAAYLLRKVGEFDEAKKLLLKEAGSSEYKHYLYTSLSRLEEERGNKQEALSWSKKARKSAYGRATKLQWIANDILLTDKLESEKANLSGLLDEFYGTLFGLNDGFSGRNLRTTQKIAKVIKKRKAKTELNKVLDGYNRRCNRFTGGEQRKRCQEHFDDLATGKKTAT